MRDDKNVRPLTDEALFWPVTHLTGEDKMLSFAAYLSQTVLKLDLVSVSEQEGEMKCQAEVSHPKEMQ